MTVLNATQRICQREECKPIDCHCSEFAASSRSTAVPESDCSTSFSDYSGRSRCIDQDSRGDIHDFYEIDDAALDDLECASFCNATPKWDSSLPPRFVKAISKSQAANPDHLDKEFRIMKELSHSNLVDVYECFEDDTFIYFVMELCGGGELFELIAQGGPLKESQVATVMRQVFRAVAHMHANGVAHRDLTCENIWLKSQGPIEEVAVKIAGFDRAEFEGSSGRVMAGSSHYAAPEVQRGECGRAGDLWSCGCIMHVLLCGRLPFLGESNAATLGKIRRGHVSFKGQRWAGVSEDAKNLVSMLLQTSPQDRVSAEQSLNHAWMNSTMSPAWTASI